MSLSIVILAAGKGRRMRTGLPKVLHHLAGATLLERVVNTSLKLNPDVVYVVYGNGGERVRKEMAHLPVQWIEQKEILGTGHAVSQALPFLKGDEQILVLYGDVPLICAETLKLLLEKTPKNALGLVIAEFDNPAGFGRIIRNDMGNIIDIIEHKDASSHQLKIKEINTGILTTSAQHLKEWLPELKNHNTQKEYYLTDIVSMAVRDGYSVGGVMAACQEEVRGINDLSELAALERFYQIQKAHELMINGVTIMDPHRFDARGDISVSPDVVIDINVVLEGSVTIGANTTIGPNVVLRNVQIGEHVQIKANCVIEDAIIGDHCAIGPFARIRPQTQIAKNVHIGNFVEVKKSQIGENSKVNHLSYLGDAVIGANVNIGAGVITVNYNGINKSLTTIENNAFVGCDTQLIAPVNIGEGAYIAAGSTITTDAPANQLTVARARQRSIKGWKKPQEKTVE